MPQYVSKVRNFQYKFKTYLRGEVVTLEKEIGEDLVAAGYMVSKGDKSAPEAPTETTEGSVPAEQVVNNPVKPAPEF